MSRPINALDTKWEVKYNNISVEQLYEERKELGIEMGENLPEEAGEYAQQLVTGYTLVLYQCSSTAPF